VDSSVFLDQFNEPAQEPSNLEERCCGLPEANDSDTAERPPDHLTHHWPVGFTVSGRQIMRI